MNEIKCPKCGEKFKIDESGFAEIVKQVRDGEFQKELRERELRFETDKKSAVELAVAKTERALQEKAADKDIEITNLKAQIDGAETKKELAINNAVGALEKEKASLISEFNEKIKSRDEMIAYYKDMKARLSTKMVGESLEQHCEILFNQLRATGFQNAYFEKDNNAKTGSKGDYIYRESDANGNEIISIMFEMKNAQDETTTTKKKNEDFLNELHKDRQEKKCEYAVLVSLLEPDNELYNSGIVDKSHRFDKMYVVRPQFFIPIITILRNTSMKALQYKSELALIRNQNIDITQFEARLMDFKDTFTKSRELAGRQFQAAIDEIGKTIQHLEKVRENLISSANNLRIANDKLDDVSVKRLTRGNPTMAAKFAELEKRNSLVQTADE